MASDKNTFALRHMENRSLCFGYYSSIYLVVDKTSAFFLSTKLFDLKCVMLDRRYLSTESFYHIASTDPSVTSVVPTTKLVKEYMGGRICVYQSPSKDCFGILYSEGDRDGKFIWLPDMNLESIEETMNLLGQTDLAAKLSDGVVPQVTHKLSTQPNVSVAIKTSDVLLASTKGKDIKFVCDYLDNTFSVRISAK